MDRLPAIRRASGGSSGPGSAFEPVRCHTFITESTLGLPIYRWCRQDETFADMRAWWSEDKARGKASIVYAYALGMAQRILAGMLGANIGPIYTHGAVERLTCDYRDSRVALHERRATKEARWPNSNGNCDLPRRTQRTQRKNIKENGRDHRNRRPPCALCPPW
ncbi:hypothetical protein BH09GEM1_BH09GEM1_44600 [soil metagenome]